MWALIMTTVYYCGSGISTFEQTAIDGFTSEQACRYAGAQQEVNSFLWAEGENVTAKLKQCERRKRNGK